MKQSKNLQACERCGKQNPAEVHTCTPESPVQKELVQVEKLRCSIHDCDRIIYGHFSRLFPHHHTMNKNQDFIVELVEELIDRYEVVPRFTETRVRHVHEVYDAFPSIAAHLLKQEEEIEELKKHRDNPSSGWSDAIRLGTEVKRRDKALIIAESAINRMIGGGVGNDYVTKQGNDALQSINSLLQND